VNLRTPLRMSLAALVIAALLAVPALAVELETAQSVRSTQGVVTAAHPLAAAAGAEILAKGGNAVDAAIATAYALAVVEPHASNLGGEGYMVISLADGTEVAIDYRSRAPLHVNVHTPAETGWPPHGILTTLIPGMVKGTELALQKYGTMTLAEVLEPAIRLAEEGFPMGDLLASQIADAYESFLLEYPEAGKVFLDNMLIPEPAPSSATLTWLMPCASSPSTAPTCSTSAKSPTPSSRPPKAGSTRRPWRRTGRTSATWCGAPTAATRS
jgi:Gamma-glutamyltransferase